MQPNRVPRMPRKDHGGLARGMVLVWPVRDEDAPLQPGLEPRIGRDRGPRPQLDHIPYAEAELCRHAHRHRAPPQPCTLPHFGRSGSPRRNCTTPRMMIPTSSSRITPDSASSTAVV